MNKQIHISTATPANWDGLVDQCELRTIYHRIGWLRALERSEGVKFELVVARLGERLLGVWPISIFRKGPMRVGASPLPGWNSCYMGPLFTSDCSDKLGMIDAMVRSKPIRNPSFIATRCMDVDLDWTSLGFERTKDFGTYELDLTKSEDELFSAMVGRCRTGIRKGISNGIEVIVEQDDGYLDDFMVMARETYAKSKLNPPYSRTLLKVVHDELFEKGELLVTSAFHKGERVATIMIPHDGITGMYFVGGTFADKLHLTSNNLLHWETIKRCQQLGMVRYDFLSNCGKPGKFKRSFSPIDRISSVHWERSKNKTVKWLRDKYEQRARAKRKAISSSTDS